DDHADVNTPPPPPPHHRAATRSRRPAAPPGHSHAARASAGCRGHVTGHLPFEFPGASITSVACATRTAAGPARGPGPCPRRIAPWEPSPDAILNPGLLACERLWGALAAAPRS